MAVFITILAVLAFVVGTNKKARAWLTTKGSSTGFTDPRILITIGLIIFNLISWKMIPWWWDVLTFTWYHFAFFNLGFWTVLYLRTIKAKDKKGDDTDKDHPTAAKLASIIAFVLVVGLLTTGVLQIQTWWEKRPNTGSDASSRTPAGVNISHGVPMEVALPIIADAESGGCVAGAAHQFEANGTTPLKNREGSSAIGKYGILASLHEERAKKMGYDIQTESGNEGYAKVLYAESGTKHWEADSRSVACWEPKLRAYTWGGGEAISLVVKAPTDKWSDRITLPKTGITAAWESNEKKYRALWNEGRSDQVEEDMPREKDHNSSFVVYSFRFKSRESEAIPITVKFY